jgi:glycosyltransferase involved in cell wall biosynthesis
MTLVSHPTSNNNVRQVALALLEAGLLDSFHTSIAPCGGNAFDLVARLPGMGEVRRRQCAAELRPLLRLHPWPEAFRLLLKRCGPLGRLGGRFSTVDESYRSMDRKVARYANGRGQLRGVYCYEDGALETFRAAKRRGLTCLYDLPIAYWRTAHRIVQEECERYPAWARTLEALHDPRSKLDRKDEELSLADVILCPSAFVADSLPAVVLDAKRVAVTPFGSPETGPARPASRRGCGDKLKVLFVGSMSQRKGLADLFAAMKLLDASCFELHVLGSFIADESFYRSECPDFVHHANRSNREVLEVMRSCDVFVLPSLVEGRALVQQEAMACGLPIIVTRNAGGEDLVQDGSGGFLVPIRDPQAIAEKLELLHRDRGRLAAMSEAARKKAETLTWESYRRGIVSIVREMLGETRGA